MELAIPAERDEWEIAIGDAGFVRLDQRQEFEQGITRFIRFAQAKGYHVESFHRAHDCVTVIRGKRTLA